MSYPQIGGKIHKSCYGISLNSIFISEKQLTDPEILAIIRDCLFIFDDVLIHIQRNKGEDL